MLKKTFFMLLLLSTAAFPSFAEEFAATEIIATETVEIPETVEEDINSEPEHENESEITTEQTPQKEPAENIVREPFYGASIEDSQNRLKKLYAIFEENIKTRDLLTGLVLAESDDRVFRRTCEFLLRAVNKPVFTGYSALIIFPRLIRTAAAIEQKQLERAIRMFSEDFNHNSSSRQSLIENLKNLNILSSQIYDLGVKLACKIRANLDHSLLLSSRRHHTGEIASFLRKNNRMLVETLKQQLLIFDGLLNQLNHHICLNRNIIDYLLTVNSDSNGTIIAVRATRSLRSFRDFRQIQENYHAAIETALEILASLIKNLHEESEALCRSHRRDYSRILTLAGPFPSRDADLAESPALELKSLLNENIQLLSELKIAASLKENEEEIENGFTPISKEELGELWGVFLNSKNWVNSELFKDFKTEDNTLAR